jgi:N6-adenosine-specific RNA methylase IME4
MLKINNEFKDLIPPLTADEYTALEESILIEGCREAIIVWNETIVDGHNRFEICSKYGIEFSTREINFESILDAKVWIRKNQLSRRNLSDAWKLELQFANKADLLEIGRERLKTNIGGDHMGLSIMDRAINESPDVSNMDRSGNLKVMSILDTTFSTRSEIAKAVGVASGTVARAEVVRKTSPELWEKAKAGEITIGGAYDEIKKAERKEEQLENLTSISSVEAKEVIGVYDVIVIDPPWAMEKIQRDVRPNQLVFDYPTMSEEELLELKLPAYDNCHVWLWTTHKFMPMAFRLLENWKLKYVCTFVWHKPGGFQPIGLPQYNCEFCLYARKGTPIFIDTKAFNTCFSAPRGKHSEKPEEFYDTVRRVTAGRRIDMFNRRPIDDFDTWGKEAK